MLALRNIECAAVLLLACTSALSASDTTFVKRGERVKVFPSMAGANPVIGEAVKLTYDTLVIIPEGGESAQTFYPGDLRKIEVSQGKGKSYTLIGLASGVAVGVGVGIIACSGEYACEGNDDAKYAGLVVAVTGVVGGLVGTGVGAIVSGGERWEEAQLTAPPPVALNVGKDGSVRLAFSLTL